MIDKPPRSDRWVGALLAVALAGLSSVVAAHDYYVDARTGNDSNQGSAQQPFRTLAPLLQRLTPCDSAYVRIQGAANDNGVGRYSHAELPGSSACTGVGRKP